MTELGSEFLPVKGWVLSHRSKALDFSNPADRYGIENSRIFSFVVKAKQIKASTVNSNISPLLRDNIGNPSATAADRAYGQLLAKGPSSSGHLVVPVAFILDFHVPPSEFVRNYGHEISRDKIRSGWSIERWGESLMTIEASGSSGLFFTGKEGLTRFNADASEGYVELMSLMQIYRNNGMGYDPQFGVVTIITEIELRYDDVIYVGSFDTLNISESSDQPYQMNYNFTFTSRGISGQFASMGHYQAQSIGDTNAILERQSKLNLTLSSVTEQGALSAGLGANPSFPESVPRMFSEAGSILATPLGRLSSSLEVPLEIPKIISKALSSAGFNSLFSDSELKRTEERSRRLSGPSRSNSKGVAI